MAQKYPSCFRHQQNGEGNIVAYTGAIDNDAENSNNAKTKYVEDAVNALLNKGQPAVTVTKAIGCRIAWKKRSRDVYGLKMLSSIAVFNCIF